MQLKLFLFSTRVVSFFLCFWKEEKREIHVMFSTHIFAIFLLEEEKNFSSLCALSAFAARGSRAFFKLQTRLLLWQCGRRKERAEKNNKKNFREIYLANSVACDEESRLLVGWMRKRKISCTITTRSGKHLLLFWGPPTRAKKMRTLCLLFIRQS